MNSRRFFITAVMMFSALGGCVVIPEPLSANEEAVLRERALEAIHRAVRYKQAGSVRAFGIEILQKHEGIAAAPWLRLALEDEEPGVRFAAALAVGGVKDTSSRRALMRLVNDPNPSVQTAAYYALHRLGQSGYADRLPAMLLEHASPEVRREAAFILGLLDEPGVIKLLAKAMSDPDPTVPSQARQSMARLGSQEAILELKIWANSGAGDRRVLALNALAELADPALAETFLYKLQQGEFLELRLAAARGLGLLGRDEGFKLALRALDFDDPLENATDPPRDQVMRVRQLAAAALGAIDDRRALRPLRRQLEDSSDPRVQLAAADAILSILGTGREHQLPFRQSGRQTSDSMR